MNDLKNAPLDSRATPENADFLTSGRTALRIEAQAVEHLADRLDETFSAACEILLNCQGRVVVIGMGKSGHVGNKMAATFASTGTPAFFVHPGEACHGDLGMIAQGDVVVALSYSGQTDELLTIIPLIKRQGVQLIALTGQAQSPLATHADIHLDVHVDKEACPLSLAPTASTTAMLAMGDALAIALLEARGFTREDFARTHPSGALGRRLLLQVDHLMHQAQDMPVVQPSATIKEALLEISTKRLGMTLICDDTGMIQGIYTDGDVRRTLANPVDIHLTGITEVMTKNFRHVSPDTMAIEALNLMEEHKITTLVVTRDGKKPEGILHIHDLLQAGLS